jgi:pyridoxamine 5'-phosphate oxidase
VTLQHLKCRAWDYLSAGVGGGRAPFTVMQAATIGLSGAPSVRTVVLRRVCEAEHLIVFYTDVRSEKVAEIRADPRIALVGYDPEGMVQLRLQGVATVLTEWPDKKEAWEASRAHSLVLYRTSLPPGASIDRPEDVYSTHSDRHDTNLDGFENFCIVQVILRAFEVLDLSTPAGHKRAYFSRAGNEWKGQWIAP